MVDLFKQNPAAKFYRPLVIYAQQHSGDADDKLIKDLKFEALLTIRDMIKAADPKASVSALSSKSLLAIGALRPSESTEEWNAYDESFKALDKALTECAEEMIAVSKNPEVQPSSFHNVMLCFGPVLTALSVLLGLAGAAIIAKPGSVSPILEMTLFTILTGSAVVATYALASDPLSISDDKLMEMVNKGKNTLQPIQDAVEAFKEKSKGVENLGKSL